MLPKNSWWRVCAFLLFLILAGCATKRFILSPVEVDIDRTPPIVSSPGP
jgi:hypothetical protein